MNIGETKDVRRHLPRGLSGRGAQGQEGRLHGDASQDHGQSAARARRGVRKEDGQRLRGGLPRQGEERLERNAASRSLNETENSIVTEIAKGAKAEIPQAMIDKQNEFALQRLEYNLMYQGIRLDDYLKYLNTTREAYMHTFDEEASAPSCISSSSRRSSSSRTSKRRRKRSTKRLQSRPRASAKRQRSTRRRWIPASSSTSSRTSR